TAMASLPVISEVSSAAGWTCLAGAAAPVVVAATAGLASTAGEATGSSALSGLLSFLTLVVQSQASREPAAHIAPGNGNHGNARGGWQWSTPAIACSRRDLSSTVPTGWRCR